MVVSGAVVVVGISVWVALSGYELWLRRSLAGAVAWLVWVSLMAEVVLFRLGLRVVTVGWLLWVASWVGDVWLGLVNVAGEWSVKVDWVIGGSVSGDVWSVVVGAVD